MRNIRKNVFETNSSSSHSVHIESSKDLQFDTIKNNGTIEIEYGEYGWEQDSFYDPISKAEYALTASQYFDEKENLKMLKEVIKEHTGCDKVIFSKEYSDYHEKGYIDHQSAEDEFEFFESKEKLKNFIFGKGSYFETDNDNH